MRLFETLALFVALAGSTFSQTYTIQTFAGGGLPESMPGTEAGLDTVGGVAVDSAGNVYIALSDYNVVMRLGTSGKLTRVAGNGTYGSAGDGGLATDAQLSTPGSLALDAAGRLYIATNDLRVRMVDNGTISTVVDSTAFGPDTYPGGPLSNFQSAFQFSIAVAANGDIYIGDRNSHRILKFSGGITTTVAGDGTLGLGGDNGPALNAQVGYPSAVALGPSGDVYFVDEYTKTLRKVSSEVITTLAGIPKTRGVGCADGPATSTGLSQPTGLAVDADGNAYISDSLNNCVRKVSDGTITTIAGTGTRGVDGDGGSASSASLNYPRAITADAAGNVYFADAGNFRVRKINAGAISTIAGGGEWGDNVRATSGQLLNPSSVAVGPANELYIADRPHLLIRKVSNGIITAFAGPGLRGMYHALSEDDSFEPAGVAVGADGAVYFTDDMYDVVRKISNGVLSYLANGPLVPNWYSGQVRGWLAPAGLAVDATGNVYVADSAYCMIGKISNDVIYPFAGAPPSSGDPQFGGDNGPATSAHLYVPTAVTLGNSGDLYIADTYNNCVRKVSNGIITTVAGIGGNSTRGFSGDGGAATSAQLDTPGGIAVDAAGNFYIADTWNDRIRKVSNGIITTIAGGGTSFGDGGPATSAQLSRPSAIAVGPDGKVYVADAQNNRIRVLIPSTPPDGACTYTVTPLAPATISAMGGAVSIAIQTGSTCSWTVTGLPAWITVSGASSGTGPATVTLVAGLNTGAALSANITVAGKTVSVSEAAAAVGICTYSVTPLFPPAVPAGGGAVTVTVQTGAGCPWTITGVPGWITLVGSASGSGPATATFLVAANSGTANQANISVAGSEVAISQSGVGTVPVLNALGSLAQIASGGGWATSLTLLNLGATSAEARVDLRDDSGNAMPLPFVYAQQSSGNSQTGSTIDQTLNPGAQLIVSSSSSTDSATGWAQLSATGDVSGFAIFQDLLTNYQAVVPLETRSAPSYVLAFDNTGGVATGLAIANLSSRIVGPAVVVRDESGAQLAAGSLTLPAHGHASFMLTDTQHGGYAETAGKRGTVEFYTPLEGQISVLGLRANNGKALTTLPVLAQVDSRGGTIPHIAFGAGWQTLLTLVNTGDTWAQVTLDYFDGNGHALTVPMFQPASGTSNSSSRLSETLAPGASLVIQTQGAADAQQESRGWAQLTTNGNVSGFAVFQIEKTLQEAVVPLEVPQTGTHVLVFDNSDGLATGLAIANAASQSANIPIIVRDDTGQQIASGSLAIAAQGHTSFMLTDTAHGGYSQTAGKRGTIEFAMPTSGQISVLGIRATPAGVITTIPALAK